jgi:hypothetical protein
VTCNQIILLLSIYRSSSIENPTPSTDQDLMLLQKNGVIGAIVNKDSDFDRWVTTEKGDKLVQAIISVADLA